MWRTILVVSALSRIASAEVDVDGIAKRVAKTRGLRFKKPVPFEVVDRVELRRRLEEQAHDDKTAAETTSEGIALKRWGLLGLDVEYEQLMLDVLSDQIAGYYDAKAKKLTILDSAQADPDWLVMVVAHELDHGLQDQAFDLDRFEKVPDDDDDALAARHALVEGDGVALMLEVAMPDQAVRGGLWADPQVADLVVASMTGLDEAAPPGEPLALQEAMIFPYREGLKFVATLRQTRPWSAIDRAFKRPPRSTEQILHVDKYLADERPIPVTVTEPPPAGYTLVRSTVWGELGVRSFLKQQGVDDYIAGKAAAGWGGDRVITLGKAGDPNPRRAIGVARFEWDTEIDAREAQAAFEHALDAITLGGVATQDLARTTWQSLDGTTSWIERRGTSVVIVIGQPLAVTIDPWALTKAGSVRARRGG